MIDFLVSLVEGMENKAVEIGPRRKARRRHRENMQNEIYRKAYREAFRGDINAKRAWGQYAVTFILIAGIIFFACSWFYCRFISHETGTATWSGLAFWILIVALLWLQRGFYRQIQEYAIEAAGKALRDDEVEKAKAAEAAAKKAADEAARAKAEADKKRAADIKKAHEARKAALKAKQQPAQGSGPNRPKLVLKMKQPPS